MGQNCRRSARVKRTVRSELCEASERVSGASEQPNGRESGLVRTSRHYGLWVNLIQFVYVVQLNWYFPCHLQALRFGETRDESWRRRSLECRLPRGSTQTKTSEKVHHGSRLYERWDELYQWNCIIKLHLRSNQTKIAYVVPRLNIGLNY